MAGVPPAMQKLQQAIETAMDELQRQQLIPIQKEAFLCSAKCCDKHQDMHHLQQWCVGGSATGRVFCWQRHWPCFLLAPHIAPKKHLMCLAAAGRV